MINFDFHDISIDHNLIIYGAGNIGKYFYMQIKSKCSVLCFIDKEKGKVGGNIDNVPILWLDDMEGIDAESACFVVTATYDFENIRKKIKEFFANAAVISLEDLIQ